MKKILMIALMLFVSIEINAQVNCVDEVKTTTPTVNIWDWRAQPGATINFWEVHYYNGSGALVIRTDIPSPFHNTTNLNTAPLSVSTKKDYEPEDGWELVNKNLGVGVGDIPSSSPYVLLYNKNTAKLRIYMLIVQLFSDISCGVRCFHLTPKMCF